MKRKLFTIALSSAMFLGNALPTFANVNNDPKPLEKTNIETVIGFLYPEKTEILAKRNLKAKLTGNKQNLEISLSDMLANNQNSISKDGVDITFEKVEQDGKITSLKFKIDGIESADGYKLSLEGKNYLKTTVDLSTSTFSKRVNISTATNMAIGDVNNDNFIDKADIEVLEKNINKENSEYDINGDGIITVADIAIVNNNMVNISTPVVFDTTMVASKVVEKLDIAAAEKEVTIEEGSLENLFKEGDSVKLAPKANEKTVSVPLDFKEVQEMASVSVTLPDGTPQENVKIKVIDESGNEITGVTSEELLSPVGAVASANNFVKAISEVTRNNSTVVSVNLGKRVPVKKVIIEVTPKDDGGFVVLDKVEFLKDVVDENIIDDTKILNIKANELSEKIELSWREVPNVTGYKVYYGESPDKLELSEKTDKNSITIEGLKNLTTYYFRIAATAENWEGKPSDIISATPRPATKPSRPDFLKATAEDSSVSLSWQKADNAKKYNVYIQKEGETNFTKVLENLSQTSAVVKNLENGKQYTIYVTSLNDIGESEPSEPARVTPVKEIITPPTLPSKDRIDNSNIESVEISNKDHYDKELYPNGFDTKWLYDGNYETSWVARSWWEENSFTFNFKEAKDMNYFVWVPRLDGKYKESISYYDITVWKDGDTSAEGTKIASKTPIAFKGENNSYYVFEFPKQENVKKIKVRPIQWDGSPTNTSVSEVAFYNYDDTADRVEALFANKARTELNANVTEEQVNKLEQEVSNVDGYVINREILLKELEIAKGLLNKDTSVLGVVKEDVIKIDAEQDAKRYGKTLSNLQPLGVVAKAGQQLTVFADIPEGETLELIPTQFYDQADRLFGKSIVLKSGRNQVTVPRIGTDYYDRGGSLYVTYNGKNSEKVKVQVLGATKIPYLELKDDLDPSDKDKALEKIKTYITELKAYAKTVSGNPKHQVLNGTEISMPSILLSLPATQILKGIEENLSGDLDKEAERVYENALAWEEVAKIVYRTFGIENPEDKPNSMQTRNNIRYMKMFSGAFMYAAGNHIGIEYDSVPVMIQGKPVSTLEADAQSNGLYGWGIIHEIGHNLDTLGKVEITNNIYPLMTQTYDGKDNTLPSRNEIEDRYSKAFSSIAAGFDGVPNSGFLQLILYWQLHLAYDEGKTDSEDKTNEFYYKINKEYRENETLKKFDNYEKFAVASSMVAQKDLTDFFEKWGLKLSDAAKQEMQKFPAEDRAVYYMSDDSRRRRLSKDNPAKKETINATVTATINKDNPKEVNLSITEDSNVKKEDIQGYEILRNGKSIGFTNETSYTDIVNTANNLTFSYSIIPIDILGNKSPESAASEVRVSYDKVVDKSKYKIDETKHEITFNEPTIVTGIKLTPKSGQTLPTSGTFTVNVTVAKEDGTEEEVLAKNGDFSSNLSQDPTNSYVAYFNKPGDTNDKMWSFDAKTIKLSDIDTTKYDIDFISYPGDNIELLENGIGRLLADYHYGEGDVIPAGTLVIVGNYRGNTVTNKIYVKGKFTTNSTLDEKENVVERPLNGYTLMFDEIPDNDKITSATTQGLFIFVPDIQKEAEIQGVGLEQVSILPTEIKVEMIKDSNGANLVTSDTLWTTMPSDESLPKIEIK